MTKKLAIFALSFAFALSVALPAFAADHQDKARRGPSAQGSSSLPKIGVSGQGDLSKLRFHQRKNPSSLGAIFEKQECSFTCGDFLVTCSGSSASCTGSSCEASGGGITLIAQCVSN